MYANIMNRQKEKTKKTNRYKIRKNNKDFDKPHQGVEIAIDILVVVGGVGWQSKKNVVGILDIAIMSVK